MTSPRDPSDHAEWEPTAGSDHQLDAMRYMRPVPAPSRLWRGIGFALALMLALAAFAALVWRGWA